MATVQALDPYRSKRVVEDLGSSVFATPVYEGAKRFLQLTFGVNTARGAHRIADALVGCVLHLVVGDDRRIPVIVHSHTVPCGSPTHLVVACGEGFPATQDILAVDIAAPGHPSRRLPRVGARTTG